MLLSLWHSRKPSCCFCFFCFWSLIQFKVKLLFFTSCLQTFWFYWFYLLRRGFVLGFRWLLFRNVQAQVAQLPLDWFLPFWQIFNLVSEHLGGLFHSVCGSLVSVFLSLDVKPDESLMLWGKKLLSLKIFLHDSCCTFGLAVLLSEADLIKFSSELISPAFSPVCLTELAADSGLSFSLVRPCVSDLLGGVEDTGEVFRAAGKSVWNSEGAWDGDVTSQEAIDWAETQTAESHLSQLKQGPLDV